jgi:hypothetical protein
MYFHHLFSLYLTLFYTENMTVQRIISYEQFKATIGGDKLAILNFMDMSKGSSMQMFPIFQDFSNSYT